MTCSRMRDEPPAYEETTGSSSTAIPGDNKAQLQDEYTRSKYGLISFSGYDRVRLMRFPESIVALVSETLQKHWPKGIQKVKAYYESTEFKLRGNPFEHGDDDEKVALRNAILGLLDALAREGWGVHPAAGGLGRIGNYKSLGQKDSLIFKRQAPQQLSWMCISFDSDDLMHLINAPSELALSLVAVFGDRIKNCNQDLVTGAFEVKFQRKLWSKYSEEGAVMSRVAILDVLQCLEGQGFTLCSSLDIDYGNGGEVYKSSGETWFCCR
ncbi:hypothetical protein BDV33DRAFT_181491 [Aspergillus novoparasiticus]|uniref:Uncharacterized protein n=1 Tax=Aspergillus novoparasiticus TaxID=986946 RepID=A0A5N6ECL8_9EURO|nr:hypothetical protein BDV33DRAFT_181491 [Aspergillus novoparasiticus]